MNVKIKYFAALLAIVSVWAFFANAAEDSRPVGKTEVPDFAFPDKVAADADVRLEHALASGNGTEVVNSLVCYALARNAVSPSLLPPVLARIDSIATVEGNLSVRSLLYLLQAHIYNGLYSRDKWRYDSREIPVDSLSTDYTEWSGEQFKRRIGELLEKAVAPQRELLSIPLKDWSRIIESNEYTYIYYPTLYDLVAYNAISIYEKMAESEEILPFRFLQPQLVLQPISVMARIDGYSRRAHELCLELVKVHADRPAPEITARLRAVECMESLAVDDDDYDVDDTYMAIYREFADTEWGGEALLACALRSDAEYLEAVREALKRFPGFFRADALRNRLARAEQPQFSYTVDGNVTPGQPFKVRVSLYNTTKGTLLFYRDPAGMKSTSGSLTLTDNVRSKAIKREVVVAARPLPYRTDTTVVVTLAEPGRYFVWGEIDGKRPIKKVYDKLQCTDLAPLTIGFDGGVYPYAVNSLTGKPMAGVTVSGKKYNDKSYTRLGVTGVEGTLDKPVDCGMQLMLSRGNQAIMYGSPWSYHMTSDGKWNTNVAFYTSLPLYHHGDSVEWALVAYESLDGKHRIAKNKKLTVKISDANGTKVDSVKVVSDGTGRAKGVTMLPADGLSGSHSVMVYDGGNVCCWSSFMVNDYKLPTFKVEVTDVKRSANPDSAVVVTCKAETYSLFPLEGAKVGIELADMPRYWWRGPSGRAFWSADSVTRGDGTLSVVLPKELLDLSPGSSTRYRITFNVTSAGGETRTSSRVFSTGKPYTIMAEGDNDFELKVPFDLGVKVFDAMGNETSVELKYTIMDDSVKVAEFENGELPGSVVPGIYDIVVAPVDSTLADPQTMEDITLYKADGPSPVTGALYVPVERYEAKDGNVDILIGSGTDDANVLVTTVVDKKMVSRKWFTPTRGMQSYRVAVPADCDRVQVMFATVKDNVQSSSTVTIVNQRSVRKLKVLMESFRDKVIPGTPERITLSVRANDMPSQASVMMLMESEAILQLGYHSFMLGVDSPRYPRLSLGYGYHRLRQTIYGPLADYKWPSVISPALDLYGYTFSSSYNRNIRRALTSSSRIVKAAEAVVEEAEVDCDAAPTVMNEVVELADAGALYGYALGLEATVVTGYGVAKKSAMTGSVAAVTGRDDTFSYRPSEIPLAFFAPMLSTDSTGVLNFTYIVPDANTSWVLKALAYTPDMLTASLVSTVTSSRPIMVQPTLPRFMRYGDSTVLRATVMNATDSMQVVTTSVSVLDAVDMSVVASKISVDTLAGGGKVTVGMPFDTPVCGQAVIYRVKSQAGNYSDGEQSLLPLLPASQPVITSTPFFMASDSTTFSIEIPAQGADNVSTLYMYDNPLWEVVTALPSLRGDASTTSIGAMNDIYMASVARGLMDKNPKLKKALRQWLESDRADSTMRSMLSRNDELRQLTLDATPWMRDAMSDSERLSALALMLDDSNMTALVKRGIKTLKKLSMADGGLAWCTGYGHSSSWATYRVLAQVASLQERGYMPTDGSLGKIVADAVDYIDRETARSLRENKGKGDYTRYAYIRSILHGTKPSPSAKEAISITVNNILKRWPGESPASKGIDAVILYRNNYPSMARKLVASIKSYSMSDVVRGTWWENVGVDVAANLLYAIETVTSNDTAMIQSVAQWLIMSKTNQSWNCGATTSATVDALLGAIDVDRAVDGTASVTLNGKSVVSGTPQLPGMTVADISAEVGRRSATLEITKNTGLQAMGSVITRSVMSMNDIPAKGHQSVSIEKRVNVVKGTSVVGADTLNVGDRVKVQLVIKVTDDLDYVTIVDRRAACLEPADQLSGYTACDGLWFYREVTDSETRMFIERLPRGTYVIDTDMNIMVQGRFSSGVATLQSQVNPGVTANSSAKALIVNE